MCKNVSLIYIKPHGSEKKIPFVKSCGKCYDCLMQNAAGFVIRCKKEFVNSASAFFVTLKYSDENLVYWNFDRVSRRRALDRVKTFGKSKPYDAYGEFILEPRHATNFFEDIQNVIKRYNPNLLFRIVLNAEYGTWTHRPHYHALIFSPLSFSVNDFHRIVDSVWPYGLTDCSKVVDARISYVALHCMKTDIGNTLQQKVAPIFRRQSTYKGGIGRDLVNDDTLLANYYLDNNFTYNGRYKVNIPRYIKKKLHPEPYSESELIEMSEKGYRQLCDKIFLEFGISEDNILSYVTDCNSRFWLSKFDISKYDSSTAVGVRILRYKAAVALYRHFHHTEVVNELRDYRNNKFMKKKLSLKRKGYFDEFSEDFNNF